MSFLDKPIDEMDLEELTRLIRQTVIKEIPPIPAQFRFLGDEDTPLLRPQGLVGDANALVYDQDTGQWTNGLITADSIAAELVFVDKVIVIGDPDGRHIRIGEAMHEDMMMHGIHSFEADGMTINFMVDTESGDVTLKGRVEFGAGSRLESDWVELLEEPSGFQTPAFRQMASSGSLAVTTRAPVWTSPTLDGSLLLCAVFILDTDGTAPTPTAPAGFTATPIINDSNGGRRLTVFKWEDAPSQSGSVSITLGDTVNAVAQIMEYTGVQVEDQVASDKDTTGTTTSTGTTAATAQNDEIAVAFIGSDKAVHSDETNDFVLRGSIMDSNVIGYTIRLSSYDKVLTATGAQEMGNTLSTSGHWVGGIATFKAKATGSDPASADTARLFVRSDGTRPSYHVVHDDGVEGAIMLGTAAETWRQEIVTLTYNLPSIAAHTSGADLDFTSAQGADVANVVAGDLLEFVGFASISGAPSSLVFTIEAIASESGHIKMRVYNSHTAAVDIGSMDWIFKVTHRS